MPSADAAVGFTTLTIDTVVYLPYLLSMFLGKGGSVIRTKIMHVSQGAQGAFTSTKPGKLLSSDSAVLPLSLVDAIMVCPGLGASTLGGVEDKDVFPNRGQVVLIRAPWVKFGRTLSDKQGGWTYVIPRRSGDVRELSYVVF